MVREGVVSNGCWRKVEGEVAALPGGHSEPDKPVTLSQVIDSSLREELLRSCQ